jgi:site-specific DNA-cytosine methylase
MAGKRLNFDDPRSKLFFEYVRILKECKPKYFLLENVRMKQESQDIISEYLGVQPVAINSSLLSAQNRYRLYWTNIPFDTPQDLGIKLQDILEDNFITDREKSHCIDANYFKGGGMSNLRVYFDKSRRQIVFSKDGLCHVGDADIKGHGYNKRVYHPEGKSPSLCAASGGNLEPKVMVNPASIVGRRLQDGVRKDNDKSVPITQCLEVHEHDKSRCLSTISKDTLISILSQGRYEDAYTKEMRPLWRKLTPLECERLQTVPDNYTNHVSNSQRYKMLGNGWTVDVIAHILKGVTT